MIPVYVQKPNQPHSATQVGWASADAPVDAVCRRVGVPEDCFITGKVINRKGKRHWSIVAYVEIGKRAQS